MTLKHIKLQSLDDFFVPLSGRNEKGVYFYRFNKTSEKIENATIIALENLKDKKIDIVHCTNLEEAVKMARHKAVAGDIVLLSPASASFDAFKNFEERGKKFKQYVNELN